VNVVVELRDIERFRSTIASCLGLQFEDAKGTFLAEVLQRRLEANHQNCTEYLHTIESTRPRAEFAALAGELTIPETYFFRNIDQFHAFENRVVPERLEELGPSAQLRILSAGCASGEEAYTIAILLHEALAPGRVASVLAVDLNPSALQKAERGRFSAWSMRETPSAVQDRCFQRDGRDVVLDEGIKALVTFEQHNLADDESDLWKEDQYDVVFLRNVIMYFTTEAARALIGRVARSLVPGGFLFLGHAETLRGITNDFHLCHTHRTFYYQRRDTDDTPRWEIPQANRSPLESAPPLASLVAGSDSWIGTIQESSDRIRRIVDAVSPPHSLPAPRVGIEPVLILLREERFSEALDLLETLPFNAAGDADGLLLRAVLLTHTGRLTVAEGVCHRLLELDELSSSAHYVLALCREGAGDISGAVDQDRVAVYLDPSFAMPRLHLGLLARRSKDFETMRRELGQAVTLLEHEDSSRLLLFGGGFERDALIALCNAQIRDTALS
jgi:chemotaxis protein methyltransferase CheR